MKKESEGKGQLRGHTRRDTAGAGNKGTVGGHGRRRTTQNKSKQGPHSGVTRGRSGGSQVHRDPP